MMFKIAALLSKIWQFSKDIIDSKIIFIINQDETNLLLLLVKLWGTFFMSNGIWLCGMIVWERLVPKVIVTEIYQQFET